MPTIHFLEAAVPLTKGYELNTKNELETKSYPVVKNFTSHTVECPDIKSFFTALVDHSKRGNCVLKGHIHKALTNESRKGSTKAQDATEWVCLDHDGSPFANPEAFMSAHPNLSDISYIVQYSASHGLNRPGLRCHIFFMLDKAINAAFIKPWLMSLNLNGSLFNGAIRKTLTLSAHGADLHWPVDITASQNDKLLYIAPPTIGKGVQYTAPNPAIQLVPKKLKCMPTTRLETQKLDHWKTEKRTLLNAMRLEAGLPKLRATRMVGQYEVQGNPGEAGTFETRSDGEYVRLNINGGDSWAYWHPVSDFTLIHSFKGEASCLTKELLPSYYADCIATAQIEATKPTEAGEIILGICDKRSAAMWKVSWNEATQHLNMFPAKTVTQLMDWSMQHGKAVADFTPQWDFDFNPTNGIVLDIDKQYLNTYVPSTYYRDFETPKKPIPIDRCPTIKKVLMSVVSNNEWNELTEHFLNWLAVCFQHKIKIGTTWVLSGTEGTGKNLLSNHILRPLMGNRYVKEVLITGLEDQFNGWLEHCLMCFVNEIQVSSSQHRKIISGKLRNWICDSPLDIRNMGQTRYDAPNYCNFIMNSNDTTPVDINKSDRRYNMGDYQDTRLVMTHKEVTETLPKELPAFFNYIMTRPASIEKATKIIETQTRLDIIAGGRTSADMLGDAIKDADLSPFVEALPDMTLLMEISGRDSAQAVAYDTIVRRELAKLLQVKPDKSGICTLPQVSKITRDELYVLFNYCIGGVDSAPKKFTRYLGHRGIKTKRIRVKGSTALPHGIEVAWTASAEWCAEHTIEPARIRRVK